MKKKIIRLTESDLHRIVKNSVKRIIKESLDEDPRLDPESIFYDPSEYALEKRYFNDEEERPLNKKEQIDRSWDEYDNFEDFHTFEEKPDKLDDVYWKDYEDRKKGEKYPYLYKKNGKEIRSPKEIEKHLNNRAKGGFNRVADQERLHRKDSLNRFVK